MSADLANCKLDDQGRLVSRWHQSAYDVRTGRMLRGPQGTFGQVPSLRAAYRVSTRVVPLRRGQVVERDGSLFVRSTLGDPKAGKCGQRGRSADDHRS
jgi:nitrite reductase/ring-hydroxylating ferredoxin subunit